jgi:hypothetical protein
MVFFPSPQMILYSHFYNDFIFSVAYVTNPFLANVKDVSWPMPLELPVTSATL